MRMWMVNPKLMCREHLLGEWRELKMFVGTLKRIKKDGTPVSIAKYAEYKLIEPKHLIERHHELREEMLRRGYKPGFEIKPEDLKLGHLTEDELNTTVPREWSLDCLLHKSRADKKGCPACQKQFEKFKKEFPQESYYSKIQFEGKAEAVREEI